MRIMRSYINEIKSFQDIAQDKQLSSGQIVLWYALMYINNRCGWQEWFTVANLSLQLNSGLSRQGVIKTRNVLKQLGLVDFRTNGTKATSYKLNVISKSVQASIQDDMCNNDTLSESVQASIQDSIQAGIQVSIQSSSVLIDETRLDETRPKDKEKSKKEKYGEFRHVKLTAEQYQQLCCDYSKLVVDEYIKKIDEWIQLNGKKEYADCNLAVRNWLNRDGVSKAKVRPIITDSKPIASRTAEQIANMSAEDLFIYG